jgi:hypothetical protein
MICAAKACSLTDTAPTAQPSATALLTQKLTTTRIKHQ